MSRAGALAVWLTLALALAVPLGIAATSPLLEWRQPIYIGAGFAGVAALGVLLVQPMLAGNRLPGLSAANSRAAHRWTGGILLALVVAHVVGLYITSPPDVVDALLFASPTPFSIWGVVAMWAVFIAALLALGRKRLGLRPRLWRAVHSLLAIVIVIGTVVHAVLIEGTMGTVSKILLCAAVVGATAKVLIDKRVWRIGQHRGIVRTAR